jgi:hypothetical protein
MSSTISPAIITSPSSRQSSACVTEPSVEFSMGTTPVGASFRRTASKTASIVEQASYRAPGPHIACAASWVNVPAGPRNATCASTANATT